MSSSAADTGKLGRSGHGSKPKSNPQFIQQVMSQDESMKLENTASGSGTVNPPFTGDIKTDYEVEDSDEDSSRRHRSSTTTTAHTTIKYSGSGGLYGESSIPSTLPAMPKLMGSTAHQYSEWKLKATGYLEANGLFEIATLKPSESLDLASVIDDDVRPQSLMRAQWARLNSKVYGAIRAAVEPILGTSFFEDIKSDPDSLSVTEIYKSASDSELNVKFKSGCAYYLWERIKSKLEQFTPHDLSRLVDKYMSLKYSPRQNPAEYRAQFDSAVRELNLAGITLPDKLHLAVWYRAIPSELESLRQALGANPKLKWTDIYEALVNQYSSKKATRHTEKSDERANAYIDKKEELKKKDSLRIKRDQAKPIKGKINDLAKKKCDYCHLENHTIKNCFSYQKSQAAVSRFAKPKGNNSDSEADDAFAAPFIEDELANTFSQYEDEELAASAVNNSIPTYFVFDSAATSHVTPNKEIVENVTNVPPIPMSTALVGQRSIINKRGTVRLNDKWTLRDVALVPLATLNLLSEGKLCDAGYHIYKNKDFVHVRDKDNKRVILRGVRANKLWIFTTDDIIPAPRPTNTIIPTKSSSTPTSTKLNGENNGQNRRPIPQKTAIEGNNNGGKGANKSS
jgi:Pol polyprotein/LTR polyprotein gag-polypeptide-like protein